MHYQCNIVNVGANWRQLNIVSDSNPVLINILETIPRFKSACVLETISRFKSACVDNGIVDTMLALFTSSRDSACAPGLILFKLRLCCCVSG
jgi:hypothetical protein